MIELPECKNILQWENDSMSDKDIGKARNLLYAVANLMIEEFSKENNQRKIRIEVKPKI